MESYGSRIVDIQKILNRSGIQRIQIHKVHKSSSFHASIEDEIIEKEAPVEGESRFDFVF